MASFVRMSIFVCIGFYLVPSAHCSEHWPWSRIRETQLVQVITGREVVLRCPGRKQNDFTYWEHMPCGDERVPCAEELLQPESIWSPQAANRSILTILEATENVAGLYRCRSDSSVLTDGYSLIQLEVLNYSGDLDTTVPEFLEGHPKNLTVNSEAQAKFQCKVKSETRPTILWLIEGWGPITFQGLQYFPLNSSGEMALAENIYLSKLIINVVHAPDTGHYICVAINTKGFSYSGAALKVLANVPSQEYDTSDNYSSFYLLFLMPIPLALVPLVFWTCYICQKKEHSDDLEANINLSSEKIQNDLASLRSELLNLYHFRVGEVD